jgi:hypothetical protein
MPEREGLTCGRSGAGVLRHLFFVIRIFRIRHGAVWSDGNPGIFEILEAKFLRERKKVD